ASWSCIHIWQALGISRAFWTIMATSWSFRQHSANAAGTASREFCDEDPAPGKGRDVGGRSGAGGLRPRSHGVGCARKMATRVLTRVSTSTSTWLSAAVNAIFSPTSLCIPLEAHHLLFLEL